MNGFTDYNVAQARFEKTKKPPRSKKYQDNERPLRRVTEDYYKLIHNVDTDSYVYRLYDTDIVEFFPKNSQGLYRVRVKYYNSQTTNQFIYRYSLHGGVDYLTTSCGKSVIVPYNPEYKHHGQDCSANLLLNEKGELVLDGSWHVPVFKRKSSKEDSQYRKDFKAKLENLVTLFMFRLSTYKENVKIDPQLGTPFRNATNRWGYNQGNVDRNLSQIFKKYEGMDFPFDDSAFIDDLDATAQSCLDVLISKKIYNVNMFDNWRETDEGKLQKEAKRKEMLNAITSDEFKTSFINKLITIVNKKEGSEKVAIEQFPSKLVRKFFAK